MLIKIFNKASFSKKKACINHFLRNNSSKELFVNLYLYLILCYFAFLLVVSTVLMSSKNKVINCVILLSFLVFIYFVKSSKNVLLGKESLWKVFWLWGVLLFSSYLFLTIYGYDERVDLLGFCEIYDWLHIPIALVPFTALVLKRNFKNIDIKNSCFRKITIFIPFLFCFLIVMGSGSWIMIVLGAMVIDSKPLLTPFVLILPLYFYGKIFRNFYVDIKL